MFIPELNYDVLQPENEKWVLHYVLHEQEIVVAAAVLPRPPSMAGIKKNCSPTTGGEV